jgi:pantoate--beta-alanine ligase
MTKPRVVKTVARMQAISRAAKRAGKKIACVPTMGYLHDGHIALVKAAKKFGDIVVATIFVNPTQFGPKEDLARYPRDFQGDMAKLASAGTDYVYYPAVAERYPENYQTYINVEKVSQGLCGTFRPVHFRGVATVVAKLFNIVEPDVAVFGNKDYQQLKVIARMVKDLNFPVKVIGHETVREKDGLAMSSRNAYLSQEDRANAVSLSRALFAAKKMAASGERSAAKLIKKAKAIISAVGSPRIEYIEIRDAETLEPVTRIERPCQMLLAVWQGKTRLIDNIRLNPKRS